MRFLRRSRKVRTFQSILCPIFISILLLGSPAAGRDRTEEPAILAPQELHDLLKEKNFLLVNVHIPYEGEIDPTDLFIAYNEIDMHLDQLPPDRNAQIVVYCRSGHMSSLAAKELLEMGYKNIFDLRGGMKAWEAAGYPLLYRKKEGPSASESAMSIDY
ncbi:MAG TPA: sulfurtransferase [Candidatus Aminicenantes bacterium]|nr:sulfurtransferase [Candidatus Aminicenantes bacterium]